MKPRVDYLSCFTYLFQYKDWQSRVLMGSLMMMVPVLGGLVAQGWLVHVMHYRLRGDHDNLPPFDDLGGMLKAGINPFLVSLLAALPLMAVMMFGFMAMFMVFFGSTFIGALLAEVIGDVGGLLGVLGGGAASMLVFALLMALGLLFNALLQTLLLRAELTGDVGSAFEFGPLMQQTRQMMAPFLIGALVIGVGGMALGSVGYMMCIIGLYPAMFLIMSARSELRTQVYRAWLAEGNPPIAEVSHLDGASLKDPALLSG